MTEAKRLETSEEERLTLFLEEEGTTLRAKREFINPLSSNKSILKKVNDAKKKTL